MGKRIPQLTAGTPDTTSLLPFYDPATDTTKYTTAPKLGPLSLLFRALAVDDTTGGTNVATAQPWFPVTGGVTVEASTTYAFEGILRLSRAAGTTSHTTGLLFGGTATLTNIMYNALVNTGDVVTTGTPALTNVEVATLTVVKAASISATEQIVVRVTGMVRTNGAGTFIPQFQYSVAPGGVPTIKANSFFRMTKIGTSAATSQGTWA